MAKLSIKYLSVNFCLGVFGMGAVALIMLAAVSILNTLIAYPQIIFGIVMVVVFIAAGDCVRAIISSRE